MNARLTPEQIEAWMDVLYRTEPSQSGWHSAFDQLKDDLTRARAFNNMLRWPSLIVFVGLVVASLARADVMLLALSSGTLSALSIIWSTVARLRFPILEIEGRVAHLLQYYAATKVEPGKPR